MSVRAKKHLGQHFLTDKNICQKIAAQHKGHQDCTKVLEIGPGMGAITAYLLKQENQDLYVMEIARTTFLLKFSSNVWITVIRFRKSWECFKRKLRCAWLKNQVRKPTEL